MKLSVVVPVYNVEKYLDKCVLSIVNQTFKDLELILVDDGSTDNSGKICDGWTEKDERIKVVHKANGGLSSARNSGIKQVQGEYISFIDSDDFIDLDMYSVMIEALERTGKDIASCGRIIDLWGEREKEEFSLELEKIFSKEKAIEEVLLLRDIDVSACDKVYRSSLFKAVMYPEGKISEDAAIIFDILDCSNGVVHVGKPFYHYIYRKNSISKSQYSHKYYDSYLNCLKTIEFIKKNYPSLVKESKVYCAQTCGSLMQNMQTNRNSIKAYKGDYLEYKKMFNDCYWELIKTKGIKIQTKIKLTFVRFGIFDVFIKLKKLKKF